MWKKERRNYLFETVIIINIWIFLSTTTDADDDAMNGVSLEATEIFQNRKLAGNVENMLEYVKSKAFPRIPSMQCNNQQCLYNYYNYK